MKYFLSQFFPYFVHYCYSVQTCIPCIYLYTTCIVLFSNYKCDIYWLEENSLHKILRNILKEKKKDTTDLDSESSPTLSFKDNHH